MSEAITPRVDIAFKKLFGVEENKDLLISLINSIVSAPDQVLSIELLNPCSFQNYRGDKSTILDIKAISHTGKYYNIEIQVINQSDYEKRALIYWSKVYSGQGILNLNKTISIHIINFVMFPEVEKYHSVFRMTEEENHIQYFKDIEIHTIELAKFENSIKSKSFGDMDELKLLVSKIKTALDRWVAFLTRVDLLKNKKLIEKLETDTKEVLKDRELEKAIEVLDVMNFSEEERIVYEGHLKWMRDEIGALETAEEKG